MRGSALLIGVKMESQFQIRDFDEALGFVFEIIDQKKPHCGSVKTSA